MRIILTILILFSVVFTAYAFETRTFVPDPVDPVKISGNSIPASADWVGTFDNQEGSYYLDFRNLTDTATTSVASITTLSSLSLPVSQLTGDLPFSNLAQVSAASILGNVTGSTADAASVATSSFFGVGAQGQVLGWDGTQTFWTATATCAAITGGAGLCDGVDATGGGGATFGQTWELVTGDTNATTPTTTVGIIVNYGTSTIYSLSVTRSTTTNATTTTLNVSGQLDFDGLTSALILAGSGGILAEYAGVTCTNQFLRILDAAGAGTCATVGTADVAGLDVSDDLNLTAGTNITLTGDDLSVDDVFILNTGDIGTGVYDFGGATSFEIPNGAPVVDALGECAIDITDNQLLCGDSGNVSRVFATAELPLFSVVIASTSPDLISGGSMEIPKWTKDGRDITQFRCHVDGGTSVIVNVSDNGTNDTETITCAATQTSDTDVATNSTFTADELWRIEIWTVTGTVDYLIFEAYGYLTVE